MVPPFKLHLITGAEMIDVLQNAEKCIESFNHKLKVDYDDQDLEGLMEMAEREKMSSNQVPQIIQEKTTEDDKGNVEREQVFCKFIFGCLYYYLFYRVITNEDRFFKYFVRSKK